MATAESLGAGNEEDAEERQLQPGVGGAWAEEESAKG